MGQDYGYLVYKRDKLTNEVTLNSIYTSQHLSAMRSHIESFNEEWGDTLELFVGHQIIVNPTVKR